MSLIRAVAIATLSFSVFAYAATPPGNVCGDQGKLPVEQRLSNKVVWTTASEEDNFGYDVYRGDAEAGPFVKLTKTPILGAGTSDETHKYQFVDEGASPCADHWYYVEAISTRGAREKFTPVFKRPAKRNTDGSPIPAKPAPDSAAKP